MGGLLHDFHLVNREEFDYWDSSHFYNHPQAVLIHDDVLRYMGDSLRWINCHMPTRRSNLIEVKGLNYYGPTIIKAEGAAAAFSIFQIWADLFSKGPETLALRGGWSWIDGEPEQHGKYEIIVADRDNLVRSLKQISDFAQRALISDGDLYVLHMGI